MFSGSQSVAPQVSVIDITGLTSLVSESTQTADMPLNSSQTFSTLNNPSKSTGLMLMFGYGRNAVTGSALDEGSIDATYDGSLAAGNGFPVFGVLQGQHSGGSGLWTYTDTNSPFGGIIAGSWS